MIEFDEAAGKMVLKLVYYGPALSGKTTNLLTLHELLGPEGRGDLMMLDTKDDRTIFFDLLPFCMEAPSGLKIKVKVFTVPGQVRHDATRKAVLSRADGVAFIADSRVSESSNNSESFENLEKNLSFVGIDVEKIPLVVQFNKRDLPDVQPEEDIKKTWEPSGVPVFMASALLGRGVAGTFRRLLEKLYDATDRKYALAGRHLLAREMFVDRICHIKEGLSL